MLICIKTRRLDDPPHIKVFPKKNFILAHCMLRAWWLHLLAELGHYVIRSENIEQLLVITNNLTAFR